MSAAFCYVPQKRTKGWSWQSFWLTQAAFCWLILPIIGAFLTVPDYWSVVQSVPVGVLLRTFLLGAAYGIGGTAFGVAIRYVGFSVTYAMAIGISMAFGTGYAIMKSGATEFFAKSGSGWVVGGMAIGLVGIFFCGLAGRSKEGDHAAPDSGKTAGSKALVGILLCVAAGLLSAVYGMALTEGDLLAKTAAAKASGQLLLGIDAATFSGNAIYPFSNAGAFLTTALYCLYLHLKHQTLGEVVNLPEGGERGSLSVNWIMAILTGCLWYGQFFFYGFGHYYISMVKGFDQTCWAIHMIMLILLGTLAGVIFKEWKGCRARTYRALAVSIALLILGTAVLARGNYLGAKEAEAAKMEKAQ